MTEPDPDIWQDALTRRLRTLVRTAPLHRFEASKGLRDVDLAGIDMRALCLRGLDVTIERMGFSEGLGHDELREALTPLIRMMRPDFVASQLADVSAAILDNLLNERERRLEFREPYASLEGDHIRVREVCFRLLREKQLPSGEIVLKATTEAINLYAGMLEFPVEDAQAADEAVLKSQLKRGLITEAVRTAERARVHSVEFQQKLLGILETTRRDVKQVDWVREVLVFIEGARHHLEERQQTERELLDSIDGRMDQVVADDLGRKLAHMRRIVESCLHRHMALHERVMLANQIYLDEQARQTFRPRASQLLPDLEADVLRCALGLPAQRLADISDALITRLRPPRVPLPHLIRLDALIQRLLAPPRPEEAPVEAAALDLEALDHDQRRFDDEDLAIVAEILAGLDGPLVSLSELLRRERAAGRRPSTLHLLVLRILGAFDDTAGSLGGTSFSIEPSGFNLHDQDYRGDDVEIRPAIPFAEVGT